MWCLLLPTTFFLPFGALFFLPSVIAQFVFSVFVLSATVSHAPHTKTGIYSIQMTRTSSVPCDLFYIYSYTRDENDFNLIIMSLGFVCASNFSTGSVLYMHLCPAGWRTHRIHYEQCHIVARTVNTVFPYAFKSYSPLFFVIFFVFVSRFDVICDYVKLHAQEFTIRSE